MKFNLTTLTPLHIGTGQKISPFEFIIKNEKCHIYDITALIGLNPILDLKLKQMFKGSKGILKLQDIISDPSIKEGLNKIKPLYSIPCKIKFTFVKKIEEFIKVNNMVYIPGSEIKGSLRRALLYYILNKEKKNKGSVYAKFIERIKSIITEYEKNYSKNKEHFKKKLNKLAQEIEMEIFRGEKFVEDAKKDVLRFVKVSDTDLKKPEDVLSLREIGIYYYNGSSKEISIFSETVNPKVSFSFKIDIDKEGVKNSSCHEILKELFLQNKLLRSWCSAEIWNLKKDDYLKGLCPSIKAMFKMPIIRLGKHEGFLSTTITAVIKDDEELFAKVFEIAAPKVREVPNKTRKLTVVEGLPLGICKIAGRG